MLCVKTRIGICMLHNDVEIRTFRYKGSGSWWLAAQKKAEEIEGKTFFRQFRLGGSWYYLAAFPHHSGVEAEIGKAMHLIAEAVKGATPICDLSQVGSADAWGSNYAQIQWPEA